MFQDAMKQIIKSRGYTILGLAEQVGVKYGSLSGILRKNNPTVSGISKYLRVLGYDIALIPNGAKLPEGSYVITKEEE
ncbi:helix-turn-helix domain-containing protein [Collinsella sp. AGMB00827]|uniref:Helix-turn-helix domain-containing protein n=1 Tax=Collinsella ureilytica TaxID=2869515 RepID=A0ABS7MLV6_9ACTN|nr:helix-turn-helix transcriptional regulator [Collinsella urealyticum]MBY4798341.1 helix-turn-helix domain-containing protein [Collinsella urealyticum]